MDVYEEEVEEEDDDETDEDAAQVRRLAAQTMGKAKTEKKAAASRENGKKGGRPPGELNKVRPITAIECTCGRGDTLEGHPTTCKRGRVIRYRQKKGLPLDMKAETK